MESLGLVGLMLVLVLLIYEESLVHVQGRPEERCRGIDRAFCRCAEDTVGGRLL